MASSTDRGQDGNAAPRRDGCRVRLPAGAGWPGRLSSRTPSPSSPARSSAPPPGWPGAGCGRGDVVGVYVPDAASYVLACHAISAAGGIPCPVSAELSIAETAGQLADCGARMLLTAQPLATAGLAAADRSWVRQVISFGDAPAATPFASLLGMGSLHPPTVRPHDLALLPYVRRADGALHPAGLTHLDMAAELTRAERRRRHQRAGRGAGGAAGRRWPVLQRVHRPRPAAWRHDRGGQDRRAVRRGD